jgi:hypothetical protein
MFHFAEPRTVAPLTLSRLTDSHQQKPRHAMIQSFDRYCKNSGPYYSGTYILKTEDVIRLTYATMVPPFLTLSTITHSAEHNTVKTRCYA